MTNLVFNSNIEHTFALHTILICFMTILTEKKKAVTKLKKWKVSTNAKKLC